MTVGHCALYSFPSWYVERKAFMLRLRPAGYAQHEREEDPLALSVP